MVLAGPLHISSSVPTEFEAMLDDAVFVTPEGVERPLDYLRSRISARHPRHAQGRRHVSHSPLGAKASEPLGSTAGASTGLGSCDWNMEPHELAQAGWLDNVDGKGFSTQTETCAGGAGSVIDYFVVSAAMAHLVQQVKVVDTSPTTPRWPVRLTLKAPSWVTGFWHDDGRSRSQRRCLWDRRARRSVSI